MKSLPFACRAPRVAASSVAVVSLAAIALSFSTFDAARADSAPHASAFDYAHQHAWHGEFGRAQSPIAIRSADAVNAEGTSHERAPLALEVDEAGASVTDNGHTVQVTPRAGSATIRGRRFAMVQAHFHAPAEHTIDGVRHPIEGHFVFRAQDGRLAVIGVVYRQGADDADRADHADHADRADASQFARIVHAARRGVDTPLARFELAPLMPKDLGAYYHYLGSLTTPPLSENVEWYVLTEPVALSAADIAAFTRLYAYNARDTQPLNGRPVIRYPGEGADDSTARARE